MLTLAYLSLGSTFTGGYEHQLAMMNAWVELLSKQNKIKYTHKHAARQFKGWLQWFKLWVWGYKNACAEVNVVTDRLALLALCMARASRKFAVVMHNFDPQRTPLKWYLNLFFILCKWLKPKHLCIITGADYWRLFFENRTALQVFVYPNVLAADAYKPYQHLTKRKQVYLGLYSTKNDFKAYNLAINLLQAQGYACYYSLPKGAENHVPKNTPIQYCTKTQYLTLMAESVATLALPKVKEGWGRVAHESCLVGTPVIGYAKGGLATLLQEANGTVVQNGKEAAEAVIANALPQVNPSFENRYQPHNAEPVLKGMTKWAYNINII